MASRHPRDRRAHLARGQLQRDEADHRAAVRRVGDPQRAGQYAYYGRVGGCLITGNEDGIKHCAMNVLYSLQHIGYTIPPQADAGWIGEAGPGPSYLDEGSGGPENDFTNRNTTFMTWNLMHLAKMLKDAGGIPAYGNQRSEWDAGRGSTSRTPSTAEIPGARSGRGMPGWIACRREGRRAHRCRYLGRERPADVPGRRRSLGGPRPDDGRHPEAFAADPDLVQRFYDERRAALAARAAERGARGAGPPGGAPR